MSADQKISTKVAIGVYAMYFMVSGAGATTAGIAALGAAFPDVPQATITMINTLPSLTIILGTLLMGAIAGKKISFKNAAILSLIIYLIFGIMPTFIWGSSFGAILVTRVITGFGMGCVAPLGAAVFTNLISDQKSRSTFLGRGGAAQQIGCVVMTLIGGFLAAVNVKYTFLAYLLCLVALIIVVVCYKDTPATTLKASAGSQSEPKQKIHIGGFAWFFIIMFLLAQMFCSPTMMNFSNLMAVNIPGQSATSVAGIAGTLLSLFVLAGAVGSLLLDKFIKGLGKFTGLVMFIICAIGMIIVAKSTSVAMFTIGIMVFGFAWCTAIPTGNLECASVTNKSGLALVASLLWALMNVGNFLSSYWLSFIYGATGADPLNLTAGNLAAPLIIGAIGFVVLGILWAVVNLRNKAWTNTASAPAEDEK